MAGHKQDVKQGMSFYALLVVFALAAGIVASALGVAYQVFLYRETFQVLQTEHKQREQLDVEWGRLLIEQQTFGATTQIGGRAVMALRMYSPPPDQTVIVAQPAAAMR
jgi:cell division protein FtsL